MFVLWTAGVLSWLRSCSHVARNATTTPHTALPSLLFSTRFLSAGHRKSHGLTLSIYRLKTEKVSNKKHHHRKYVDVLRYLKLRVTSFGKRALLLLVLTGYEKHCCNAILNRCAWRLFILVMLIFFFFFKCLNCFLVCWNIH